MGLFRVFEIFNREKKKSRKTLILQDLSYVVPRLSLGFRGERGSRTYAFRKYHKIANH